MIELRYAAASQKIHPVTLSFPNRSRSYDASSDSVRFWGYDGAFEICFFVQRSAFAGRATEADRNEAEILSAFDQNRDRIISVAMRAYRGRADGTYMLVAADF